MPRPDVPSRRRRRQRAAVRSAAQRTACASAPASGRAGSAPSSPARRRSCGPARAARRSRRRRRRRRCSAASAGWKSRPSASVATTAASSASSTSRRRRCSSRAGRRRRSRRGRAHRRPPARWPDAGACGADATSEQVRHRGAAPLGQALLDHRELVAERPDGIGRTPIGPGPHHLRDQEHPPHDCQDQQDHKRHAPSCLSSQGTVTIGSARLVDGRFGRNGLRSCYEHCGCTTDGAAGNKSGPLTRAFATGASAERSGRASRR